MSQELTTKTWTYCLRARGGRSDVVKARIEVPAFELDSAESVGCFGPNIESLRAELVVIANAVSKEREDSVGGVTMREMWLGEEGFVYKDGDGQLVSYERILRESEVTYAEDELLSSRFAVERVAWVKAVELARKMNDSEVVVMLSPPGQVYQLDGQPKLSATFFLKRVGGNKYLAYSAYIPEISEKKHSAIFGLSSEMDTNELVQSPILIGEFTLNRSIQELGFAGWGEIERRAVDLDNKIEYENRVVYQAILDIRKEFESRGESEFWDIFHSLIRDLLLKDVMGELKGMTRGEIYKQGLVYLSETSEGTLRHDMGWVLIRENISVSEVSEWRVRQGHLQEQMIYRAMWGGHGNGSSMPDFGQKGQYMDARTGQYLDRRQEKKNSMVECVCGKKISREKVPCNCPSCGKKVSKGGA